MSTQALPFRAEYDPFASLYDRHMGADFARRAFPVVERLLLARLAPGSRLLDLCCGSGRMTSLLCSRGCRVTGVDASEPMLRLARRNAPQAQFVLGDARRLAFPPVFAAAVSSFNSLAHLHTLDDLARVCVNVRSALAAGGAWLFDLTMEDAYLARWRGSYALVEPQVCCLVRPSYDAQAKLARNDITLFYQRAAVWKRSDFTIFQKCHAGADVRAALRAAAFTRIEAYDAERDLAMTGESGRTLFLAS
jgi:SAM-dependent methyltransferase